MERLKNGDLLAPPGFEDRITLRDAAKMIGIGRHYLGKQYRRLRPRKHPEFLTKLELIRIARKIARVHGLAIARLMNCRTIIAVTSDPKLRRTLNQWDTVYADNIFRLGQLYTATPCRCIVIDWDDAGSSNAIDAARQICKDEVRPRIVGVLPADIAKADNRYWDALVARPWVMPRRKGFFPTNFLTNAIDPHGEWT